MKIKPITNQKMLQQGQLYIRFYGDWKHRDFWFQLLRLDSVPFKIGNKRKYKQLPERFLRNYNVAMECPNYRMILEDHFVIKITQFSITEDKLFIERNYQDAYYLTDLMRHADLYPFSSFLLDLLTQVNENKTPELIEKLRFLDRR